MEEFNEQNYVNGWYNKPVKLTLNAPNASGFNLSTKQSSTYNEKTSVTIKESKNALTYYGSL